MSSLLLSDAVTGKYRAVCEAKRGGRQGAGRPHISVDGSELWPRPIACPISCAITLRATLGSDSGGPLALRIITTAPWPPRRVAWETNTASDNTTTIAPDWPEALPPAETGPRRKPLPIPARIPFQCATAACTNGTRGSPLCPPEMSTLGALFKPWACAG